MSASQIFSAVLSSLPVQMRVPSAKNAMLVICPSCPERMQMGRPVAASQIRAVLSSLPVTMRLPSVEIAHQETRIGVSLQA